MLIASLWCRFLWILLDSKSGVNFRSSLSLQNLDPKVEIDSLIRVGREEQQIKFKKYILDITNLQGLLNIYIFFLVVGEN